MVKDHSDSERGNPLLPHGLLFSINRFVQIIVVAVVNNKFPICYLGKEITALPFLPAHCIQSVFIRIESLVQQNGGKCKLVNYIF